MEIRTHRLNHDILKIDVSGEMDLYNSHELKSMLTAHIENGSEALLLDLHDLSYIDSSGISVLLYTFTQCKKRQLGLCFLNIRGSVKRVIELTSLQGFFPIAESLEDAINRLRSR
ncbi:MAG: STAS domain-containing protein [Alkalispirochaetaceae bacterium]